MKKGGSYVSLVDPAEGQLTLIIETMTHDHSICIRPHLPKYQVISQNATFTLKGSFSKISSLHVWHSKLGFDKSKTVLFQQLPDIIVKENSFTLHLETDSVFTITTIKSGRKGSYSTPPEPRDFPLPYSDSFDQYELYTEAFNFAPQIGSFEIVQSSDESHVKVKCMFYRPV